MRKKTYIPQMNTYMGFFSLKLKFSQTNPGQERMRVTVQNPGQHQPRTLVPQTQLDSWGQVSDLSKRPNKMPRQKSLPNWGVI